MNVIFDKTEEEHSVKHAHKTGAGAIRCKNASRPHKFTAANSSAPVFLDIAGESERARESVNGGGGN